MATYKSRFPELGFYLDGDLRKFTAGRYVSADAKEIAILDELTDAERVDEEPAKDEVKPEEPVKPAPKAPAARKPSGK